MVISTEKKHFMKETTVMRGVEAKRARSKHNRGIYQTWRVHARLTFQRYLPRLPYMSKSTFLSSYPVLCLFDNPAEIWRQAHHWLYCSICLVLYATATIHPRIIVRANKVVLEVPFGIGNHMFTAPIVYLILFLQAQAYESYLLLLVKLCVAAWLTKTWLNFSQLILELDKVRVRYWSTTQLHLLAARHDPKLSYHQDR